MSWTLFLQIFLLVNVFFIGVLASAAVRHARAHFSPAKNEPPKPQSAPNEVRLTGETKERLLKQAEGNFKAVLDHSADLLNRDLTATAGRLDKLVERMGTEIIGNELEHYRKELTEARKQAEGDLEGLQAEVAKYQQALRAKLAEEVETERQRLIQQIDTKLADAVASFLIETLQHNVDLGAQTQYLTAILEEHKADFAQEVTE